HKFVVLRMVKGGNAADAAVAAGFTLAVVEPSMSHLGGRIQVLVRSPDGRYQGYNSMTEVPAAHAPPEEPVSQGYGTIATPGVVAGLVRLHAEHGSLPWSVLPQEPMRIAHDGFALLPGAAARHEDGLEQLKDDPGFQQVFIEADGSAYDAGDLVKQPALARTITRLAEAGAGDFYQGEIAQQIAADMAALTEAQWAAVMNQVLALTINSMADDPAEPDLDHVADKAWAANKAARIRIPPVTPGRGSRPGLGRYGLGCELWISLMQVKLPPVRRQRVCSCSLVIVPVVRGIFDFYALHPGALLHLFLVLGHELRTCLRIAFGEPELFAVLVALLNAHQFAAVNAVLAKSCIVRCVDTVLVAGAVTILCRVRDSVAVTKAVPIEVFLATFDLRTILWLRAALPVAALRKG
ncbi:MAG: gamma-glutamyltransferase, partial [Gammaproteobacteria bacterium]|nr:gamma-glutamyltransferase [Gammaproteobacteria bacterium]